MERLTERELNSVGSVHYCQCYFRSCDGNCGTCELQYEADMKLKEYEDLEEQGLLLRLPCKVGNTVWCLEEDDYAGYVFLSISGEYYIVSSRYTHCDNINEQLEEMKDDTENWGETNVGIFHKDKVFLTKAEAEKALAEMGK